MRPLTRQGLLLALIFSCEHQLEQPAAPTEVVRQALPNDRLRYYGGRVISNVRVYEVNWTAGTNATLRANLPGFYAAVTNSAYLDWLSEYDTVGITGQDLLPGSNQRIGRGTFGGSFTITPFATDAGTTVKNSQIHAELAAQIDAGFLPAPDLDDAGNVNALYMIDFPASTTIIIDDFGTAMSTSCTDFCAYAFATLIKGRSVPYAVFPDSTTGACMLGCGGTTFASASVIHSHTMVNAITNTEISMSDPDASVAARPTGWYYDAFPGGGAIGDLCAGSGIVAGYTVAKQWSNTAGACIVSAPDIICDGNSPSIPGCRSCAATDDGAACNGARPFCETRPGNAKLGQCVACTMDSHCPAALPQCIVSTGLDDDSCAPDGGFHLDAGSDAGSDAGTVADGGTGGGAGGGSANRGGSGGGAAGGGSAGGSATGGGSAGGSATGGGSGTAGGGSTGGCVHDSECSTDEVCLDGRCSSPPKGCGCATGGDASIVLLALAALLRRRREPSR